jgi:hypothetical protein
MAENYSLNFTFIISALVFFGFGFAILSDYYNQNKIVITISIICFGVALLMSVFFLIGAFMSGVEFIGIGFDSLSKIQFIIIVFFAALMDFLITIKKGTHNDLSYLNILKALMAFIIAILISERLISLSLPGIYNIILAVLLLPILSVFSQIMIKDYYLQLK